MYIGLVYTCMCVFLIDFSKYFFFEKYVSFITTGMRGATGNNHMNGPGIARSDYDQERLVHERFGNEFRELKIQVSCGYRCNSSK